MNTLYIVSCGTQQRAVRLPAAQLYVGSLWSASITHARHFAKREQDVRILSLKHGLLVQGQLVEPYDEPDFPPSEDERASLVANIRRELPRGVLPLRIVMLSGDEGTALFRAACAGTRFEEVPVRAPLNGLSEEEQIQWMQTARWFVECKAELPALKSVPRSEDRRLEEGARAAAVWWSRQLMRDVPPPEPSLFADALALELRRAWEEVYSQSRGEWPEDIRLSVDFRNAPDAHIRAALGTIGLDAEQWWKREWDNRRFTAQMAFAMDSVRVQVGEAMDILWETA